MSSQFHSRVSELSNEKLKMECLCLCSFSDQLISLGKLYITDRRIVFYRFRDKSNKIILWEEIQDVADSWFVNLELRESKTCQIYTFNHQSAANEITKIRTEMKGSSWWRFLPL